MKNSTFVGIVLFTALIYSGCTKDTSTDTKEAPEGTGLDYFPLSDNMNVTGKAVLQATSYDSLGNIINLETFNQEVRGFMGNSFPSSGRDLRILYGYDPNGSVVEPKSNHLFVATDGQAVLGISKLSSNPVGTLLPSSIKVGTQWVVNPLGRLPKQVSPQVTDYYKSYTNSAGRTFTTVIKIVGAYSFADSTVLYTGSGGQNYDYRYYSEKFVGEVYLAKSVGFVDAKITTYETISKTIHNQPFNPSFPSFTYSYSLYSKKVIAGTVSRTN